MSKEIMDSFNNNDNLTFEQRCEILNKYITNGNKIVFFGGAGVSTASGIPDFRSPDGLYNMDLEILKKRSPEYLLSSQCFYHEPKYFYQFYKNFLDIRKYVPNIAHTKLAELEKMGKMISIVTQNIDGFHQAAGSNRVFEIHGTINTNHCIKCGKEFDVNYIFDSTNAIPRCTCGRENCFVRPNVVLYGENLPKEAYDDAMDAIEEADVLIVCGTSLKVNPAASMINHFAGEHLIIINRDETSYDDWANLIFREDISDVFSKIIV